MPVLWQTTLLGRLHFTIQVSLYVGIALFVLQDQQLPDLETLLRRHTCPDTTQDLFAKWPGATMPLDYQERMRKQAALGGFGRGKPHADFSTLNKPSHWWICHYCDQPYHNFRFGWYVCVNSGHWRCSLCQ